MFRNIKILIQIGQQQQQQQQQLTHCMNTCVRFRARHERK
jgi:hypothetical protein